MGNPKIGLSFQDCSPQDKLEYVVLNYTYYIALLCKDRGFISCRTSYIWGILIYTQNRYYDRNIISINNILEFYIPIQWRLTQTADFDDGYILDWRGGEGLEIDHPGCSFYSPCNTRAEIWPQDVKRNNFVIYYICMSKYEF